MRTPEASWSGKRQGDVRTPARLQSTSKESYRVAQVAQVTQFPELYLHPSGLPDDEEAAVVARVHERDRGAQDALAASGDVGKLRQVLVHPSVGERGWWLFGGTIFRVQVHGTVPLPAQHHVNKLCQVLTCCHVVWWRAPASSSALPAHRPSRASTHNLSPNLPASTRT